MRQLLVFAVGAYGAVEVTEASDGVAALKAIRAAETPFDLILLDVNMPIMDGVKLLGYLRTEARVEHTVIAVVTTESDDEAERKCRELGAQHFLRKPVTKRVLDTVLRAALG